MSLQRNRPRTAMGLFGKSKPPDPKLQCQEWCKKIRKEGYAMERQINGIKREEQKVTRSIKDAAKRGDKDVCRVLAKEVVASRKAVKRLYTAKANLSSVELQIRQQASQLRVAGSLQQSTEVMKAMQQLVKLPELQKTMADMSKEMMKAGIIEEMMEDAMENLEEEEELEDDVQAEVDKILTELTTDKIKAAPKLPEAGSVDLVEPPEEVEEEEKEDEAEEEIEEMQSRLQALRS